MTIVMIAKLKLICFAILSCYVAAQSSTSQCISANAGICTPAELALNYCVDVTNVCQPPASVCNAPSTNTYDSSCIPTTTPAATTPASTTAAVTTTASTTVAPTTTPSCDNITVFCPTGYSCVPNSGISPNVGVPPNCVLSASTTVVVSTSGSTTVASTTTASTTVPIGPPTITSSFGTSIVFAGTAASIFGSSSSSTVTASVGTVTMAGQNADGSFNWVWTNLVTSPGQSGSVVIAAQNSFGTTPLPFYITILQAPPSISFTSTSVSLDSSGKATNTGVTTGSTLTASAGKVVLNGNNNKFTWTASSGELQPGDLQNGIIIYSTASDGTTQSTGTFFVTGGSVSPAIYSLHYSLNLPSSIATDSTNGGNFISATAYLTKLYQGCITVNLESNSRQRMLLSSPSKAQVVISNLSLGTAQQLQALIPTSVGNGNYQTLLEQTAYLIQSSGSLSVASPPAIYDAHGNPLSSFPLWAMILIGVLSGVLLICLIVFISVRYCCCQRRKNNESMDEGIEIKFPNTSGTPKLFSIAASSSPRLENQNRTIYFKVLSSGETIPFEVFPGENLVDVKSRLETNYPTDFEGADIIFLFNGKPVPDTTDLSSTMYSDGTTIHVVVKVISKSTNTIPKTLTINLRQLLENLARKNNASLEVRKEARDVISSASNTQLVNETIKSSLDELANVPKLSLTNTSHSWLPNDKDAPDSEFFGEKAAIKYQKTLDYSLVGKVVGTESPVSFHHGLVQPINISESGAVEGVNSIIWEAKVEDKTVVIKGLLPFNNIEGYDHQFASQDCEYKIPLSMPHHPHIIPILHQFTGSSALVYPWITKEVRDLSTEIYKSSGRRFIRRFTTYIVMESYPSSLRKHLNSMPNGGKAKMSERSMCLIALQLLQAVAHMNNYKIVHRDIKDDNIFRTSEGRLVLADFGCALNTDGQVYQRVEDLTASIGSANSIAPEVHRAIKDGPSRVSPKSLWDIMKQNDVYAVGRLLYSILNIHLPTSTSVYENSAIPTTKYSITVDRFLKSLVACNPVDRLSAQEAVNRLQFLLWGPGNDVSSDEDSINNWVLERKLDLVFNASVDGVKIGFINPPPVWPLNVGSVETVEAARYFQTVTAADIIRCRRLRFIY